MQTMLNAQSASDFNGWWSSTSLPAAQDAAIQGAQDYLGLWFFAAPIAGLIIVTGLLIATLVQRARA